MALTDGTPQANACNALFQTALDDSLQDFEWRFATAIVPLVPSGAAPLPWSYQYLRPTGCVKARAVLDPTLAAAYLQTARRFTIPPSPFSEGSFLVSGDMVTGFWSNVANAVLVYTTDQTDPAQWEPAFTNALSWRVAMEIALPITNSAEIMDRCQQGYRGAIMAAQEAEPKMNSARLEVDPDWLRVRGGSFFSDRFLSQSEYLDPCAALMAAEQEVLDSSDLSSYFASGFVAGDASMQGAPGPSYLSPAASLNGVPSVGLPPFDASPPQYIAGDTPSGIVGGGLFGPGPIGYRRASHGQLTTVIVNGYPVLVDQQGNPQ